MTSRQISEWLAFCRVEGFGGPLLEMMIGILAARVVNSGMGAPTPPLEPEDSMPHYDAPPEDVGRAYEEWKRDHGAGSQD